MKGVLPVLVVNLMLALEFVNRNAEDEVM